jgi:hypothetical protein
MQETKMSQRFYLRLLPDLSCLSLKLYLRDRTQLAWLLLISNAFRDPAPFYSTVFVSITIPTQATAVDKHVLQSSAYVG